MLLLRNWRAIGAVITVLVALGGVGALYAHVKHQGYVEGYATASAECEADKRAMEEANRKAIAEAEKKLLEAERELTSLEIKLDDYLMALDLAADAEPDRDKRCLPRSSVRRLSQF